MILSIIVAVNRKLAIGFENRLIYRVPNDLKRFKALTTGHTIIMGRKTFDSLPKGALPNRRNIVLSRQELNIPGAECFHSLEEALKTCRSVHHRRSEPLPRSTSPGRPSLPDRD